MAPHFPQTGFFLNGRLASESKGIEYISEQEVARRTGIKIQTLRNWRHLRKGFSYVKLGRAVRYSWQAVQIYLEERTVDPEQRDC
jgi:hypothetical protein